MMNKIYYTIIIPHKNIPDLLQRCLDSIPIRDDLQIIVVDDNSDTDKVDFKNFPGNDRKDVEIIFSKEGKGGGYARNIGLSKAKGTWLLFADADDYFNYCINNILDEYLNSDADIIYFKGNCLTNNTYLPGKRTKHLNAFIDLCQQNPQKGEIKLRYLFGEPWCKMIKRNLVETKHIRFDETSIHNDTTFSYLTGHYANKVQIDNRAIYCVTIRENSVSVSISDSKKIERIAVFSRSSIFFKKHNVNIKEYRHFIQLIRILLKDKKLYDKSINSLHKLGYTNISIFMGCVEAIYNSICIKLRLKKRY